VVSDEEKRFSKTLKDGLKILNQNISSLKESNKKEMDPKDAFRLYETYGFPVEDT
jgi:alanyl-tRNA synthetase